MIFAIIENGLVINTIIADQDFVDKVYPDAVEITELNPRPAISWTYDGSQFIAPVKPVIDETISE
jgi:hypothetical protein